MLTHAAFQSNSTLGGMAWLTNPFRLTHARDSLLVHDVLDEEVGSDDQREHRGADGQRAADEHVERGLLIHVVAELGELEHRVLRLGGHGREDAGGARGERDGRGGLLLGSLGDGLGAAIGVRDGREMSGDASDGVRVARTGKSGPIVRSFRRISMRSYLATTLARRMVRRATLGAATTLLRARTWLIV